MLAAFTGYFALPGVVGEAMQTDDYGAVAIAAAGLVLASPAALVGGVAKAGMFVMRSLFNKKVGRCADSN